MDAPPPAVPGAGAQEAPVVAATTGPEGREEVVVDLVGAEEPVVHSCPVPGPIPGAVRVVLPSYPLPLPIAGQPPTGDLYGTAVPGPCGPYWRIFVRAAPGAVVGMFASKRSLEEVGGVWKLEPWSVRVQLRARACGWLHCVGGCPAPWRRAR
jgi:hypothetical protein